MFGLSSPPLSPLWERLKWLHNAAHSWCLVSTVWDPPWSGGSHSHLAGESCTVNITLCYWEIIDISLSFQSWGHSYLLWRDIRNLWRILVMGILSLIAAFVILRLSYLPMVCPIESSITEPFQGDEHNAVIVFYESQPLDKLLVFILSLLCK